MSARRPVVQAFHPIRRGKLNRFPTVNSSSRSARSPDLSIPQVRAEHHSGKHGTGEQVATVRFAAAWVSARASRVIPTNVVTRSVAIHRSTSNRAVNPLKTHRLSPCTDQPPVIPLPGWRPSCSVPRPRSAARARASGPVLRQFPSASSARRHRVRTAGGGSSLHADPSSPACGRHA